MASSDHKTWADVAYAWGLQIIVGFVLVAIFGPWRCEYQYPMTPADSAPRSVGEGSRPAEREGGGAQ